jgi:outer membrane protein assembly factor BamB
MKRSLILLALAAVLCGCSTIQGWFSDSKAENIEPPTPLTEFPQTLSVQKLWSERVGKRADVSGARMGVAYSDGKIFAASVTGDVTAFDAATGHTLWHKQPGSRHGWIWHHGDNSVRWAGGPLPSRATWSLSARSKAACRPFPRTTAPIFGPRSCRPKSSAHLQSVAALSRFARMTAACSVSMPAMANACGCSIAPPFRC